MKIPCRYCKILFTQDHPNRRVCDNCKSQRNKEAQKKKYAKNPWYSKQKSTGICIICKSEFYGTQNRRKFCSMECSYKHRKLIRAYKGLQKYEVKLLEFKKLLKSV